MTEKRGRKRKQLLDDLEETRACLNLKEKDVSPTLWGSYLEEGMSVFEFERERRKSHFMGNLLGRGYERV